MAEAAPDFSKYSIQELEDANRHINREKYPDNAKGLDNELARRQLENKKSRTEIQTGISQNALPELELAFNGSARDYFRVWIVNLCLTLLTFGIFSAWAKVRKRRFSYSNTTLDGTPFQYLGQPIPILKGRIIAAAGLVVYFISTRFAISLLPYVLIIGLIAAPWVLARSAAFNARYSAFRNMTFHFDAGYFDAMKTLYAWGIAPLFVLGIILGMKGQPILMAVVSVIAVFAFPFWIKRLKKFIVNHTIFGGKRGEFFATGGQYFKIYFISGLIMMIVTMPIMIFVTTLAGAANNIRIMTYLAPAVSYTGYIVSFAYIRARSYNLAWNNTCLGPIRFQASMSWRGLLGLYMTNAIGIIFSLGLLIPWAVVRTWKYKADKTKVLREGALGQFQGSDTTAVPAFGAETLEFFDMDLSL